MELSLAVPVSTVTKKNQTTIQYSIHYIYHKKKLFLNIPNSTFFLLGRVGAISLSDKLFYDSSCYIQQSFYISDVKCHRLRSKANVSGLHSFLYDIQ